MCSSFALPALSLPDPKAWKSNSSSSNQSTLTAKTPTSPTTLLCKLPSTKNQRAPHPLFYNRHQHHTTAAPQPRTTAIDSTSPCPDLLLSLKSRIPELRDIGLALAMGHAKLGISPWYIHGRCWYMANDGGDIPKKWQFLIRHQWWGNHLWRALSSNCQAGQAKAHLYTFMAPRKTKRFGGLSI